MKKKLITTVILFMTNFMINAQVKNGEDISPFPYDFEMLVSKQEIESRIKEAARRLEQDYQGKSVVFICIMKGLFFLLPIF